MPKVAFTDKYFEALNKLSGEEQKQANKACLRFQSDPSHSSLHYEKLSRFKDKKLRSIRANQEVRIILSETDTQSLYLLLYIDHHEEAYDWAENRRVDINPSTGVLQVYSVVERQQDSQQPALDTASQSSGLFDHIKDKHLLQLGIPEAVVPLVRAMKIEADLENARDQEHLPQDAYDALYILLAGGSFEEAYLEVVPEQPISVDTEDYSVALAKPESRRAFVVAENESELEKVLSESLEKWRVFLHPLQRRLAIGQKNGPVRVLGGAGTGKTVVAMHRAKWLAANVANEQSKILFTTFTRNLAADIKANLQTICTSSEMDRIEVVNLDSWVMHYLKRMGYDYNLLMNSRDEESMWQQAYDEKPPESDLELPFFKEEWSHVIQPQSVTTIDLYKKASRIGRGTRLNRAQRVTIWPVFAEYRRQLSQSQYKEADDAYRDACDLVTNDSNKRPGYAAIIVDEAQDMGTQAFRMLRAMVAEGKNDLFIVGDGHQRIYGKNKVVLGQCGIDIRGRSARLKINYRTTDETRQLAVSILEGVDVDDLDGGSDTQKFYHSLMHGPAPGKQCYSSLNEQCAGIKGLTESFESDINACCVIARTNNELKSIAAALGSLNIPCHILEGKSSSPPKGTINLATMHRVKGLEFDYVILASANKGMVPYSYVIDKAGDPVTKRQKENEERSLVYVSLTRARKQAFVLAYGEMSEWF